MADDNDPAFWDGLARVFKETPRDSSRTTDKWLVLEQEVNTIIKKKKEYADIQFAAKTLGTLLTNLSNPTELWTLLDIERRNHDSPTTLNLKIFY